MTSHPHRQSWHTRLTAAFAARTRTYRSRGLAWRLLGPAVFLVAGILFVTSMVSSRGMDLRAGRYDDLDGLANAQAKDLEGLRARAAALTSEVDRLTADLGTVGGNAEQKKAKALEAPAGLSPVSGPGVTITLDDAPKQALDAAGDDLSAVSELLVHQQDIQAVVNSLWAGGAEAMTIQDQRVVSTTGVKCVGNVVILHGVPYSPPYRDHRDRPHRRHAHLGDDQPVHPALPAGGRRVRPRLERRDARLGEPARLLRLDRPRVRQARCLSPGSS